jgi:hypothetical protein
MSHARTRRMRILVCKFAYIHIYIYIYIYTVAVVNFSCARLRTYIDGDENVAFGIRHHVICSDICKGSNAYIYYDIDACMQLQQTGGSACENSTQDFFSCIQSFPSYLCT